MDLLQLRQVAFVGGGEFEETVLLLKSERRAAGWVRTLKLLMRYFDILRSSSGAPRGAWVNDTPELPKNLHVAFRLMPGAERRVPD